jgi:hypothetical protein
VSVSDVCFKRDGVFAMELGGPEVGRGCGGRGIIHGFETLEKLGFHDWDFDYVLLDFLGDVVCGGFGLPIARDMCQKVIVVASNDLQSLYVANNVCSAVQYFRRLGGNVGVAGMVTNKDDGTGEAAAFCKAAGIPELAAIPANEDIRRKSANYEIVGRPDGQWGSGCLLTWHSRWPMRRRSSRIPCLRTNCWAVRWRHGGARRGAAAGDARRSVRCAVPDKPVPRGDLRRCLILLDSPGRSTQVIARSDDGRGLPCRRRKCSAPRRPPPASRRCSSATRGTIPQGPHDQPQSMCPAFGSLRVGLRMRRTATVLCGSACCVYGLTFTSHFYGAKRTVGYVPFDSETLVTGKLFEDLREAAYKLADPDKIDALVLINLCVPTASGVPLDLLPKEINGVRIIGIDVPGFGVPTHAEAKDILAGAMLEYARGEAEQGPVARPSGPQTGLPTVALVGEIFPVDAIMVGRMLEPLGLAAGPVVPTREWRELYAALASPLAAMLHPFYTATARQFKAAGRSLLGSAPVGVDGTEAWLSAVADAAGCRRGQARGGPERPAAGDTRRARRRADRRPDHPVGVRGLGVAGGSPAGRGRRRPALCRDRVSEDALVRSGSRVAGGARRAGELSRVARGGHRGDRGIRAGTRRRYHTGGAACQGARDSGPVLHQPDFRAASHGPRRRRLPVAGDQHRRGRTRAHGAHGSLF